MKFRQFLLMKRNDEAIGAFAIQATSDRNWVGNSAQSLRSHLRGINAPPETMDALFEAEKVWTRMKESDRDA